MPVDIMLTVVVTSVIQSIFGVGVLLFGTPLLLLLGYDFIQALIILLPISISINLFQIVKHYAHIDSGFYRSILLYTIPFVMLFLFIVANSSVNISAIIGLFLLFVALKNASPKVELMLESMVRYERIYFIVMGIVHGLTNLGGSLLTAIVHGKGYGKDVSRVTIAVSYATFAVFQIITLWLSLDHFDVPYLENAIYLVVGVLMFLLTEEMVYHKLDNDRYARIFAVFLFVSGLLLIVKSL